MQAGSTNCTQCGIKRKKKEDMDMEGRILGVLVGVGEGMHVGCDQNTHLCALICQKTENILKKHPRS